MRCALITIAHGRHAHLLRQYEALGASTVQPDDVILVAMDDRSLADLPFGDVGPTIVDLPAGRRGLPLAAARNAGAEAALRAGADVLIFLDVDCLPGPGLVESYLAGAADPAWAGSVLCGPVTYLPPAPEGGYDLAALDELADPHPARPAPEPGTVIRGTDPALFWSLSFAVTAQTWRAIGGFADIYEGYGAEDTDFALTAKAAGVHLAWVGGARAFHQHHPTANPPVQHLDDIVHNANIYFERWGAWPMGGWLEQFQRAGLVRWTADSLERRRLTD